MKIKYLIFCCLMVACAVSCQLIATDSDEDNVIDYYSREVELYSYVDSNYEFLEPVESRIYGEDGELSAVFKYYYEDQESTGYYANTLTEVYEVDDNGDEILVEYYKYEYMKDEYEYEDDDGVTQTGYDYILTRGETYTAEDDLAVYYLVNYLVISNAYDCYTSIIDYEADGTPIARQESTYLKDSGYIVGYRTEKFYELDDTDNMILSEEYACWYDDDDDYDYELYHSYWSNDNNTDDEFYYFTQYSRDGDGNVYEQADFEYTYGGGSDADYSFTLAYDYDYDYSLSPSVEPFAYSIVFDSIGDKATVLTTDYDSSGNIILDERSLEGTLSEYTSYSYNSSNELLEQSRYTQGGTLLYDRTSIRYTDEYRDGDYYRVKTTYTYKYYDYEEESQSSRGFSANTNKMNRVKNLKSQNNRKEVI
jgi:hypothetical protein